MVCDRRRCVIISLIDGNAFAGTKLSRRTAEGIRCRTRRNCCCPNSESAPLQYVSVHTPLVQNGVDPPQTLPQAPQLSGSKPRKVQVPLQRMAPATQS